MIAREEAPASNGTQKVNNKQSKESLKTKHLRKAGGKCWNDPTLNEWPDEDFRVFCGDLGNEVTDETLAAAFRHFRSFAKAKVVRDGRTGKNKGYGFVSFTKAEDMLEAMKTMDRKYVGNRPIRVMKSKWKQRDYVKTEGDLREQKLVPLASKMTRRFVIKKKVTAPQPD